MKEISVADLRAGDVGRRVVVIHDGGTIDGMLREVWTSWAKYAKPEPGPRTRLTVTAEQVEAVMQGLPGDYLLQIDSDEVTA